MTLILPQVEAPKWFAPIIEIHDSENIVILDDDATIHQLWESRVKKITNHRGHVPEVLHFYDGMDFKSWFLANVDRRTKCIYLFDYELREGSGTGLELIQELNIVNKSILVTSHFEEEFIQQQCLKIGLRMIHKAIASRIPLEVRHSTANQS